MSATKNIVSLDVRPTLASGEDPFNIIMNAVKILKDEETLQIINSFEPIPLIKKITSQRICIMDGTTGGRRSSYFF